VGYFEEGRVRSLSVAGSEVTATVQGSQEYRTEVDLAVDGFAPWCSCPYDYAGECKHVVAVLLAVKDRYEELVADELTGEAVDLVAIVDEAAPNDLRAFVVDVLQESPNLRDRFLAAVGEAPDKTVADYKREIDHSFEAATGRRGIVEYDTRIDFSEYHDLTATYRDSDDHDRALDIYRALSEAIRENFDRIDDSSGHYGTELERAIQAYAKCLDEADFGIEPSRDHLDYLIDQSLTADFAFVRDYYDEALRDVCTSPENLQHWRERLKPELSQITGAAASDEEIGSTADGETFVTDPHSGSLPRRSQAILSTYLYILDELDERETAVSLLEDLPIESSSLYLQYVDLLADQGRNDRAIQILEEGLEEFPRSVELRRRATELYRDHDPTRYRECLKRLFVDHEDWDAYEELREACSDEEWSSIRHGIVTTLGRIDPQRLIDVYLHEGKEEKAFSKVLESDDLDTLDRYQDDVADIDPNAYFDAYRDRLEPFLADQTGRTHYRTVIGHLERMAEIDADRELASFVDRLKEKHSNRPALLDELEKAGF
jgi:tetratricopeptide (TPR) repeat protein